jgi:thiol-disulfide isomerase/thioredoxin
MSPGSDMFPVMHTKRSMLALALLFATFAILHSPAFAKTRGEVEVGGTLRDVFMQGLNGPNRKMSAYRGKALLINVWASWCGPCKQEMGSLERLAWSDAAAQFSLIGISTDDSEEAAKAYLLRSNATITHYIDHALVLENMLGAERLPLTILVDANGKVLGKFYGARDWDSPEAMQWIKSRLRMSRHLP